MPRLRALRERAFRGPWAIGGAALLLLLVVGGYVAIVSIELAFPRSFDSCMRSANRIAVSSGNVHRCLALCRERGWDDCPGL